MVRMGQDMPTRAKDFLSTAVDASEEIAEQLASTFRVDVDSSDLSEVVAAKLAEQMRQDAFRAANGAKFERELDEKYGVLKDVILHPTVQWLLGLCGQLWRSFHLFGKPPLGTTAGVVVGLMIYRRKIGFANMSLTAAVLSGFNPLVFVVAVLLWKLWSSAKFLPKGCRVNPECAPPEDVGEDKLSDDFTPDKVSSTAASAGAGGGAGEGIEEYDHIVVGSDLGGLFCAALLSRCGRRVLVLEQGPLVGAGAVVKAPKGTGEWEFETGMQCLGGGDKLGRFVKRLQLACLPGSETVKWEKVGRLESELGVHDMVSVGDGKQTVAFPAEQEKLLESLMAQFPERRTYFKAFFAQVEKATQSSLVFYLNRLFPSRPRRWLDRVLIALFLAPTVGAHTEIAKRSVKGMLAAMQKVQPDGNDDLEAAQSALCALFRRENLTPDKVSYAALMEHTSNSWGGLYHPRGGFRALAEGLVDAIRASGGRVLTRARVTSVLVEDGRAVGVSVTRETSSSSSSSSPPSTSATAASPMGPKGETIEVRIATTTTSPGDGRGSVISSIGVIETFRHLVPSRRPAGKAEGSDAAAVAAPAPVAAAIAAVSGGGGGGSEGWEPEGFRDLRAARPRVHLCVGLQGNWLEDLDGTSAYFHHVRNSMAAGSGGGGDRYDAAGERDWYRISFGESKDSSGWRKGTTTCVLTAEMGDDMTKLVVDGAGTTGPTPIGPLRYTVQTGRSARDRMRERLLRRLHQEFPLTEGRDEYVMLAEEPRAGLSHGPERYLAEGVRAPTKLPGFFLAGEDLTMSGMEGAVMGGWIAAHAALGYTPADMFLRQRTLASDIPNLDKLQG